MDPVEVVDVRNEQSSDGREAAMVVVAKVAIVDDHPGMRDILRIMFDKHEDFDVVAEAGSCAETVKIVDATRPDVLVLDIHLTDGDGLDLLPTLRGKYPNMAIVIHTMYTDDELLFKAMDGGANAFVSKASKPNDVIAACRAAVENPGTFISRDLPGAVRRLSASLRATPALTERETVILEMLAKGNAVPRIAEHLGIAESTTKANMTKLYTKLGARNRSTALVAAMRLGLISSTPPGVPASLSAAS